MKITAKVDYTGCEINEDGTTGHDFSLVEGESRDVSDRKAEQLKTDFPDWFDFGKGGGKSKQTPQRGDGGGGQPKGDETPADEPADYSEWKRPQLIAEMEKRGIEYPKTPGANSRYVDLLQEDDAKRAG